MTTQRVNYSKMEAWVDSSIIADAAQAIREDGASFAGATADVGPTWHDLQAFFVTSAMQMEPFFGAGDQVTSYGGYVQAGGDNIAKAMEDCAQTIKGLETKRADIIERADEINAWLSTNPPLTFVYSTSTKECTEEQYAADRYAVKYERVLADMADANKNYANALQDMADRVKSLDDDGSTANRWLDTLLDVAIIGGAVIGVFIPPVGAVTTAVEVARYYAEEYQKRERELLEEYPEMYDRDIGVDATKTAVVNGSFYALQDKLTGDLAGPIVEKLAKGIPLTELEEEAVQLAVEEAGAPLVSKFVGDPATKAPDSDSTTPPGSSPSEPQMALEEAKQRHTIKDYDGDGYTDDPFMPNSDWVEAGFLEPAEEIRVRGPIQQASDIIGTYAQVLQAGQAVADSMLGSATQAVQIPVGLQTPMVPDVLAPRPEFGPPAPAVWGPPAPVVIEPPAPMVSEAPVPAEAPAGPKLPDSL